MAGEFNTRCRHNERKNEEYGNGDIDKSREHLNVHFKENLREMVQARFKIIRGIGIRREHRIL